MAEFAVLSLQEANSLSGNTYASLTLFQGLTILGAQARRRLVADENISARFNLNVMVAF